MDRRPIQTRNANWAKVLTGFLCRTSVTPNQISVLSVLFAVAGGILFLLSRNVDEYLVQGSMLIAAAACIQLRLLCNMLDGMIAVEKKLESNLGGFYNEVPDRISDVLFLVCAGYALDSHSNTIVLGWSAAILSVFTAYVRVLGASMNLPQDFCGPMAKPQRMFVLTLGAIISGGQILFQTDSTAVYYALGIINIGAVYTAIRRIMRLGKSLKK